MRYAGVLLFSMFIGLQGDKNQNVGAEGVHGKVYNVFYAKNGYACDYFAPNFFFSTTNRAIGDGNYFEFDLGVISGWNVSHFDGARSQGYSLLFGELVFGSHTTGFGTSESLVGFRDPTGSCYPD